jgi:hypothetical protein
MLIYTFHIIAFLIFYRKIGVFIFERLLPAFPTGLQINCQECHFRLKCSYVCHTTYGTL